MKVYDIKQNMKVGFTNDNTTYIGYIVDTKPVEDEGELYIKVKLISPNNTVLAPLSSLLGVL